MIPATIKSVVPEWLVAPLRRVYHQYWMSPPVLRRLSGGPGPSLVPFDEAYPEVEKRDHVPPKSVAVPEMARMAVLHERADPALHDVRYVVPEDYVTLLDDVLYSPTNDVLVEPRTRAIVDESLNNGAMEHIAKRELFLRSAEPIDGVCMPLRSRFNNYYHTLVDNVPRLLALDRPPYNELPEIKLLCSSPLTRTERFFLGKVAPPNARVVQFEKHRLYRPERVIFTPFKTQRFAGYIPEWYVQQFREKILPKRPSLRTHRLFISREHSPKRRISNRDELYEALKPYGFVKVCPETLSFEDEINLFYDAEVVVGAHGSGLTNTMFGRDLKVVELFPTQHVTPHFYFLIRSFGHEYAFWCGDGTDNYPTESPVDVDAVLDRLASLDVLEETPLPS